MYTNQSEMANLIALNFVSVQPKSDDFGYNQNLILVILKQNS